MPEILNGTYVINLAEHKLIGGYWIALWVNNESESEYCKSFEAEQIPKEIKKIIRNKNIRIQAYNTMMWGY